MSAPSTPNETITPNEKGIEPVRTSTKQRIATLGIAAAAVITLQGTVAGAGNDATTCQTWHPQAIVADQYQHTWNPENLTAGQQHTWNPEHASSTQHQHSWNPEDVADAYQHILNPQHGPSQQHSWNPSGDEPDVCLGLSPATP